MPKKYFKHPCLTCKNPCMRKSGQAYCSLLCKLKNYIVYEGDCWMWKGCKDKNGYGKTNVGKKYIRAHRLSYELLVGPIDSDKFILHSCHKPSCINPAHLRQGTNDENMAEMVSAKRNRRGSGIISSKLLDRDVIEIRRLYACGLTQTYISKRFSVSQPNIGNIVRRDTWKHL